MMSYSSSTVATDESVLVSIISYHAHLEPAMQQQQQHHSDVPTVSMSTVQL
jgi:glucuronate isomerase